MYKEINLIFSNKKASRGKSLSLHKTLFTIGLYSNFCVLLHFLDFSSKFAPLKVIFFSCCHITKTTGWERWESKPVLASKWHVAVETSPLLPNGYLWETPNLMSFHCQRHYIIYTHPDTHTQMWAHTHTHTHMQSTGFIVIVITWESGSGWMWLT